MSLSKQYKTDKKAETEGIRCEMSPNEDGTIPAFVIGRANRGNSRWAKALERITKPHRRALEMNTLPKEKAAEIWMQVFIQGSLYAWEHVLLSDVTGNENDQGFAPFTNENAVSLFTNLPDLYDELSSRSGSAAEFRIEALEQEAGN
jgi:hypothetical protein